MTIQTAGRTDLEDFFAQSGILTFSKLQHTPYLAFVGDDPRVEIVNSTEKLLRLPNETPVMVQWAGKWSSDFFQMTVGDVREAADGPHGHKEREGCCEFHRKDWWKL